MNTLPFLITWRYLLGTRSEKNISIMVLISFLGIFIGALALALVASIMNGFEKVTHQKLQGIHAQIIMRSMTGEQLNDAKIQEILTHEFPDIEHFSPSTYKQVIIQKPESDEITNAVIIKGINPAQEINTSSIGNKIVQSSHDQKKLNDLLSDDAIVIGDKLAKTLGIEPGQKVNLLYLPEQHVKKRKITLDQYEVVVSGIFSTGIEEFDSGLILASFPLLNKLFPESGVTQFNIQLKKDADEKTVVQKLKNRFGLDVFSWKDLYPALVAALKLEKYAMFFILALITLVACMNIISLIFMQIIQKRPDIAIYQAMGMRSNTIISLFMLMGVGICSFAAIAGLITAYGIGLLIERYPFIQLPDTYYVSHLPIKMEWPIFFIIFILIVLLSIIATWIPCRNIRAIHAANVLRFEG